MRTTFIGILSILLICIQSTILKHFQIRGIIPNLILIFIVTYAILKGSKSGGLVGLFIGSIQDILFFKVFGFYTLLYFYIGFLAGYFNKDFYKENYILPLVLITISDFIFGFFIYIFTYLFRGRIDIAYYFKNIILPEMVYTTLLAPFIYKIIYSIDNKISEFENRF